MPENRPVEAATANPGEKRHTESVGRCVYGIIDPEGRLCLCVLREHDKDVEHDFKPALLSPTHVLPTT